MRTTRLNLAPKPIQIRDDPRHENSDKRVRKQQIENLLTLDDTFDDVNLPNKDALIREHQGL